MLHCVTAFFPPSECQNCQSCLLEVGTSARSKDGDFPRRRSTNCNLWQLQKQNSKLSFPGTCNLGSVLQLETKAAHCSCSLLLITLPSAHHLALPSPGPSRKHTCLNRVCACLRVCVFTSQVPRDPAAQSYRAEAWVSSHIWAQKKGWKLSFTSSFPRLSSSSASGFCRASAPAFPPALATGRLWIPPEGGGRGGCVQPGRPGAAAAQPQCPAHGRPQCGATPRARQSRRRRAQAPSTHPPHPSRVQKGSCKNEPFSPRWVSDKRSSSTPRQVATQPAAPPPPSCCGGKGREGARGGLGRGEK